MAIADITTALRRHTSRFLRSDGGNLTMIATLAAIPIIGAAGMAVDYARISRVKDKLQLVTDGATLAAAGARNVTGTADQRKQKRIDIATNYLTQGLATITDVDVVDTPVVTATASNVSISVKATVKGSFMNVFNATAKDDADFDYGGGGSEEGSNGRKYDIRVSSQSGFKSGASYLCMLVLNPTAAQSLEVQGTADIDSKGCAIWVNSNSMTGLYENGVATVTADKICVRGYYAGTAYYPDKPKSGSIDCPLYPDPLAAKFATDYATAWAAAVNRPGHTSPKGGTETLYPGKYVGGLTINNGGRITLSPGIYFMVGDKMNIKAGGEVFANGGVTIVLTDANVSSPVINSSAKLTVIGKGNLSIKAPSSGPFAGIAIAQHPNSVPGTTKSAANNIQGGGTVEITGIIYYPKQVLYITGGGFGTISNPEWISKNAPLFAIVADKVFVEGNGQLKMGQAADFESSGLPQLPVQGTGKTTVSLK